MRQVGHLAELYEDARSEKFKINTVICKMLMQTAEFGIESALKAKVKSHVLPTTQ